MVRRAWIPSGHSGALASGPTRRFAPPRALVGRTTQPLRHPLACRLARHYSCHRDASCLTESVAWVRRGSASPRPVATVPYMADPERATRPRTVRYGHAPLTRWSCANGLGTPPTKVALSSAVRGAASPMVIGADPPPSRVFTIARKPRTVRSLTAGSDAKPHSVRSPNAVGEVPPMSLHRRNRR